MKNMKITYAILAAALLGVAVPARASEKEIPADTARIGLTDGSGREVVTIEKDGKDKYGFSMNVGGLTVDFIDKKEKNAKERQAFFVLGNASIGFIGLTSPDYSMYPAGTGKFLRLDHAKSISVALDAGIFVLPIGRKNLWLETGFQIKWDNYVFRDRHTLTRYDGMIFPEAIPDERGNHKKSKLTTFSLNIPLTMRVKLGRTLSFNGGLYGDLTLRQHTKVKFPKEKTTGDFGVNFFQWGLTGEVIIRRVGSIYFRHGITPLFESGVGPKTRPFSVGISRVLRFPGKK